MKYDLQTVKSTKRVTTDIANYVKGRLKRFVMAKHFRNYHTTRSFKMMRRPCVIAFMVVALNILTVPSCFCERLIDYSMTPIFITHIQIYIFIFRFKLIILS